MTRAEALEILGLDSDASLADAREAYRALAKIYHPDKSSASNATAMFRIISDAWEVIRNTDEQEHTETEIRSRYPETEEERKHSEEEQRRRAETKAAQAEENLRRKEKKIEKNIKRFSYLGWFIFTSLHIVKISISQNVIPFISIIYCVFIMNLGTLVCSWLTGWVFVKTRKIWFYKKGKEKNLEVKIRFRSCVVWFIIIIIFTFSYTVETYEFILDMIFGLQSDDSPVRLSFNQFITALPMAMLYMNVFMLGSLFLPMVLLVVLSVLLGRITGSIILKTSAWFKKKG